MADEIVRNADIPRGGLAVEIGPGTGRLTRALATAASRVVAIELDRRLASQLAGRWPNVAVVNGDARVVPLPAEPFVVVANLPFAHTNDLLHALLDEPSVPLLRADLIVEWGVACKRGLPWPSTVHSVAWGAFYEATVARRLPARAFTPVPRVDGGLLVFRRRTSPLVAESDASRFRSFVARGFRHGLRTVAPSRAALVELRGVLPRDLDAHEWAHLFRSGEGRT